MKYFISLAVLGVLFVSEASAQRVFGKLTDAAEQTPLSGATVLLLSSDTSVIPYQTVSSDKGEFEFKNIPEGKYLLSVSSIGHENFKKMLTLGSASINLGVVSVSRNIETLENVIVKAVSPPVVQKGDTTIYSASQFKVNQDASTEDLIKKMPGIQVDSKGKVTAQGEDVKKVTVDGKDFFGDDATATLRNLPAEIVDKIQVYDRQSEQSKFTGMDDGNDVKSINIVTQKDKRNGQFGKVYAGYGTDNHYKAGGMINFFNNDRRISVLGMSNNVNQRGFSDEGDGGSGGNGISKSNALGINFNDQLNKKLEVAGSYFFNNGNRSNNRILNRQNFIGEDSTQYYDEIRTSQSKSNNHKVNLRLDYKIDSNNSILLKSGMSFNTGNSVNGVDGINSWDPQSTISKTKYTNLGNSSGNSLSNDLLFRHRFAKKGRTISLGINTSFNTSDNTTHHDAADVFFKGSAIYDTTRRKSDRDSHTDRYGFSLAYTEPIAEKTQLEINYRPSFQKSVADYRTLNFDNATSKYSDMDTSLSNKYNNQYNRQNIGLRIRRGDRKNMISAGISYQYSELKGTQVFPYPSDVNYTFSNILGSLYGRIQFSKRSNLRIYYRGSADAPSIGQLQDVINTNNSFFYSTGNPDLKESYSHSLGFRFRTAEPKGGKSFFAGIRFNTSNNFVTNATYTATQDSILAKGVVLRRGSQLSKPINLDNSVSANSFLNYGMPLKFIKSNLNLNGGFGYSKRPGLLNDVKNISEGLNYNFGISLSSNISEFVDFDINYHANVNRVNNTLRPTLNNNYFSQHAGLSLKLYTKKGLFLTNNVSNESFSGLSAGYNQNYWLWNVSAGQKFLKGQHGELKLSVFDLLKQNQSISRSVTESHVQDVQSQVLQQYFMLSFTYKLRNFGNVKARNSFRSFDEGGHRRYSR